MSEEVAHVVEALRGSDTLWDRVQQGGTPLLDKLAALSDDEWAELTHRMTKHFQRELAARGMVIVHASLLDGLTDRKP